MALIDFGWCGLEAAITSFVRDMPKVELHVHLEGSIEAETLLALAERNKISLPYATADAVRQAYKFRSFSEFARALLTAVGCIRALEDFSFLVQHLGAAMHRQNIGYAEVTWTPQLYGHLGYTPDEILAALNDGRSEVRRSWGVEIRWIPDLVRSYPQPALKVQSWAVSDSARDGGVVALGLGGPETAVVPPEIRAVSYTHLRAHET